jgi:hypothetical protein
MKFDCRKLNEIFQTNGPDYIEIDKIEGDSGCGGHLNSFYGKKHTNETKQKLKESTLKLCESEEFRKKRANYAEKNGMYGNSRFGELNPMYGKKQSEETKNKISQKAKLRYANGFKNCLSERKITEKEKQIISDRNSKIYKIISPEGKLLIIKNLTKYSKENNLNPIMMSRVSRGLAKKHKGYTTP